MLVNSDFSKRAIITPEQYRWVASPQAGVDRMMLDRLGGEHARATSIVRYAANSRFPRHAHAGGEEILVISGTFSDETGDFPAGWYVRNPPRSSHQPFSQEGATILVKLWQMKSSDTRSVGIDTRDEANWTTHDGQSSCVLFADVGENVSLQRVPAGARLFEAVAAGGAELFVLDGELKERDVVYPRGTWIRLPAEDRAALVAGIQGAKVWLKTGHLAADAVPRTC